MYSVGFRQCRSMHAEYNAYKYSEAVVSCHTLKVIGKCLPLGVSERLYRYKTIKVHRIVLVH
jgi:hypothetical protein